MLPVLRVAQRVASTDEDVWPSFPMKEVDGFTKNADGRQVVLCSFAVLEHGGSDA